MNKKEERKEKSMKNVHWCGCMDVRPWKDGFADIFSRDLVDGKRRGEIYEFFKALNLE